MPTKGGQVDRTEDATTRLWLALKEAKVPGKYRRAAEIVEQRGWTKGTYYHRNTGKVDLTSAIAMAFKVSEPKLTDNWEDLSEAAPERHKDVLLESLRFVDGYLDMDQTKWNDTVATSVEDVTRMLNELADKLEAMG